jgi:hypothetical protein
MRQISLVPVVVAVFAVMTPAAHAASFAIDTYTRGNIDSTGFIGFVDPLAGYNAGFVRNEVIEALGLPSLESRNFFQFSLPVFSGRVTSARLRINAGLVQTDRPPVTYQITSLVSLPDAADDFAAVGTGTPYGDRDFLTDDTRTLVSLDLNKAGRSAMMSGGTFLIGGRVTNGDFFANSTDVAHALFGDSGEAQVTLEFDTAVPEPASWAMLITGFGLTGAVMRRRRLAMA